MELTIYNAAKRAVSEYKTVDEVKDFRDKAVAIEAYARQAQDFQLEREAAIARVRAERRCGELLAEMEKAKGGQPYQSNGTTSSNTVPAKTLADLGITKDQSSKWQQLAAVPADEFEAAIDQPGAKPSTTHIIKRDSGQQKRIDSVALWFWGRLMDMERNNLFQRTKDELLDEMTEAMRQEAERIIPQLKRWIQ